MNINELNTYAEDFEKRRLDLRSEACGKLHELLESIQDKEIISEESLGFFLYEDNADLWVEESVHGMRLDEDGDILLTSELDYSTDGRPFIGDWDDCDREMTFSEFDDSVNINWPLTLTCTLGYLKYHPDILTTEESQND